MKNVIPVQAPRKVSQHMPVEGGAFLRIDTFSGYKRLPLHHCVGRICLHQVDQQINHGWRHNHYLLYSATSHHTNTIFTSSMMPRAVLTLMPNVSASWM